MDKKHALLLALLITILIYSDIMFFKLLKEEPLENVRIKRVIDGDTIELYDERKIRLLNINSPEKYSPLHKKSLQYLSNYENATIEIDVVNIDKYGRTLARVYSTDGRYINLNLVKEGFASKFLVDDNEITKFSSAELNAINNEKGMWKHSEMFNCIESEIDKYAEVVTLKSKCGVITPKNWTIKDESTKQYNFPDTPFTIIKIHSKIGNDNETDLFWNSKTNIWNNDRDTIYIFDSNNHLVHYSHYGY